MAANHANVVSISGAGPISISAYTQIFAATPFTSTKIILANSCDQNVAISVGAAGSEVDLVCVAKGCTIVLDLSLNQIPGGSRIAGIAEGAATTSGFFTVSLIQ